jgi:NhaP-type Na+/H+ or K+/H+ antiporter
VTEQRADRAANLILTAVLVVTCGTLLLAAVAIPLLLDQGSTLDAQQRSDEITGCRSSYRVELIDAPQLRALQAFALGDEAGMEAAVEQADPDRYEDLSVIARTDPDEFLRLCRRDKPGE